MYVLTSMPIGGDTFLSMVKKSMAFDWSFLTKISIQLRMGTSIKRQTEERKLGKERTWTRTRTGTITRKLCVIPHFSELTAEMTCSLTTSRPQSASRLGVMTPFWKRIFSGGSRRPSVCNILGWSDRPHELSSWLAYQTQRIRPEQEIRQRESQHNKRERKRTNT